jgi:HTH-type transcriptional regulator, sugar sensing transcriptional regulator
VDVSILEDIGLTQSEIKTYLTLLELGTSSAGKILEKSGIQNSVLHRALNSLSEKGLINFILDGKKKVYQATNPENFHNYIEDKRKRFDEILPELKARQSFAKNTENATIYKGKRGITEVYNTLVNSKAKEYLTFGGGEQCLNLMGDAWWSNVHRKRLANKMPARQVWDVTVAKFSTHDFMQTKMTHIRFLPQEFAHFQETAIVGDYVAITLFTDNPYSILIKDKVVADGYKKFFELMWKISKGKQ